MDKSQVTLRDMNVMGLSMRTSFQAECNPATSKIVQTVGRYWQEGVAATIPHRKNPGVLYAAYTAYESDYLGGYTYFIGEEVTSIDVIPEGLSALVIPAGTYTKLTTPPGPLPQVIIEAWKKIWGFTEADLGGSRLYHTDFEVYDERARDPRQTVADIYIGVRVSR